MERQELQNDESVTKDQGSGNNRGIRAGDSGKHTLIHTDTHTHSTISTHKKPGLVNINHHWPVIVNSLAEGYMDI